MTPRPYAFLSLSLSPGSVRRYTVAPSSGMSLSRSSATGMVHIVASKPCCPWRTTMAVPFRRHVFSMKCATMFSVSMPAPLMSSAFSPCRTQQAATASASFTMSVAFMIRLSINSLGTVLPASFTYSASTTSMLSKRLSLSCQMETSPRISRAWRFSCSALFRAATTSFVNGGPKAFLARATLYALTPTGRHFDNLQAHSQLAMYSVV
mmetsp:Transcript_8148/g.20425  ORF Transcript_8148/g.20425 Transcript_8148/m.20425 type:complete len:208 (-) Transcript_8148:909-1532(-)